MHTAGENRSAVWPRQGMGGTIDRARERSHRMQAGNGLRRDAQNQTDSLVRRTDLNRDHALVRPDGHRGQHTACRRRPR